MDKNFVEIIQLMVREQGKEVLVNGRAKLFLSDYRRGQFPNEADIFLRILDANCGELINNADNVLERKQKLMVQLEEKNSLSPRKTAEYLDLLGLILRRDKSKSAQSIPLQPTQPETGKPATKAPPKASAKVAPAAPSVESLMKRGKLFLEDSDWKQADEYFDRVLDIDPEYAPAYVGKLCAELEVCKEDLLAGNKKTISELNNFKKAVRFADAKYRAKLEGYNKSILERIVEEKRKEQERKRVEQERIEEEKRQERIEEEKRQERERRERERITKQQRQVLKRSTVEAIIEAAVKAKGNPSNWKVSIVDLMSALDLNYSLTARKKLAEKLGYNGSDPDGSAEKNMWLHKELMKTLAENGGKIPKELLEEQQRQERERITAEQERQERERIAEQQRQRQREEWISQGLCHYCGGKLGLMTKVCKSCGKDNKNKKISKKDVIKRAERAYNPWSEK